VLLCFVDLILGDLRSRGFSSCRQTSENLGARILTLHLNYVAGYTGPLLFLFDFLQADPGQLTTKGKPWRLRVWAGPTFVRLHQWGVTRNRTGRYGEQSLPSTKCTTKDRVCDTEPIDWFDDLRNNSPSLDRCTKVDWKKPAPPGGVSYHKVTMFPHQEPCVREPPSKDFTRFFEGGPLTHSFWWGNIDNRETPRAGDFFRSK